MERSSVSSSVKCGKVCPTGKKCSRKTGGGFCYQHGGSAGSSSARTVTPKKASPKKSPPGTSIPWLDALPMPALQEVLLNMDYHTLNATCRTNKRAASICRLPLFRKMYMEREKGTLFFGELKQARHVRNNSGLENMLVYFDDAKNELDIVYDRDRAGNITMKRFIYSRPNDKIKIILELGPKSAKKMFIGNWQFSGKDISKPQDISRFLESIGKSRWEPEKVTAEGRQASSKSAGEFHDLVKKATINFTYK